MLRIKFNEKTMNLVEFADYFTLNYGSLKSCFTNNKKHKEFKFKFLLFKKVYNVYYAEIVRSKEAVLKMIKERNAKNE